MKNSVYNNNERGLTKIYKIQNKKFLAWSNFLRYSIKKDYSNCIN